MRSIQTQISALKDFIPKSQGENFDAIIQRIQTQIQDYILHILHENNPVREDVFLTYNLKSQMERRMEFLAKMSPEEKGKFQQLLHTLPTSLKDRFMMECSEYAYYVPPEEIPIPKTIFEAFPYPRILQETKMQELAWGQGVCIENKIGLGIGMFSQFTPEDCHQFFQKISHLEVLSLTKNNFIGLELDFIASLFRKLPHVRHLNISCWELTLEDVPTLYTIAKALPCLSSIGVDEENYFDITLPLLKALLSATHHLGSITFSKNFLKEIPKEHLEELLESVPNLRQIGILRNIEGIPFPTIHHLSTFMRHLREVKISGEMFLSTPPKEISDTFQNLPHLQSLSIREARHLESLSHNEINTIFGKLTNLRHLALYGLDVTMENKDLLAEIFGKLTKLEYLSLNNTTFENHPLVTETFASSFSHISSLNFSSSSLGMLDNQTVQELFSPLTRLVNLDVYCCQIENFSIVTLQSILNASHRLHSLNLSSINMKSLSFKYWEVIQKLPSLRHLSLQYVFNFQKLHASHYEKLGSMFSHLQTLDLHSKDLLFSTEDDLRAFISPLSQLTWVRIPEEPREQAKKLFPQRVPKFVS